ncbi:brachyurin-like [Cloeon dipterum]|uniref:brachyurin-like n=1 Tax=Cloeon dipterum TaxID=197152 RepID=UPI0032208A8A
MKLLVCVLLTFFCANGAYIQNHAHLAPVIFSPVNQAFNERLEERILGGTVVLENELPYIVAIFFQGSISGENTGFCGGSLISERHVLTAAHCVKDYTFAEVVLGTLQALNPDSQGYLKVRSSELKAHEAFERPRLNDDIALITLSAGVPAQNNIRPIPLPTENSVAPGDRAVVAGWGKISDDPNGYLNDNLLKADVVIADLEVCRGSYGSTYINDTKLCVETNGGSIGTCHGDSGTALATAQELGSGKVQIGVMSFGSSDGCESGFPNVYTRVDRYLQWIADNGGPSVQA